MNIYKEIIVDLIISTNDICAFLFGFNVKFKIGRVLLQNNFENKKNEIILLNETPDTAKQYIIKKIEKYFKYHPYINDKITYLKEHLHYHEDKFENIINDAYEKNKKNENLQVYLCLHC